MTQKILGNIEKIDVNGDNTFGGRTFVDSVTLIINVPGKAAGALDFTKPVTITQEGNE